MTTMRGMMNKAGWTMGIVACMAAWTARAEGQPSPADMQRGMEIMQKQMALMSPELVEKAKALSPEIKQFLVRVALRHERRSDTLTLVQVMQEIMVEHQAIGVAIATDNGPLAADAARRLAFHRLPKGGMLPYLPIEKVTTESLSVLPSMEAAVEGNATKIAEAAERGDMAAAAHHYGEMTAGCVACHMHFRGQPGASAYVPRLRK
ncbi:MAG: cytochrome c [Rhodocyclaceae bacterium]|nr:cytochrome c [Rhodocyclaceae bacterium]